MMAKRILILVLSFVFLSLLLFGRKQLVIEKATVYLAKPAIAQAAILSNSSGVDPQVTLTCNKNKFAVGDTGVFISDVIVPTTETKTAKNCVWSMVIDSHFTVTKVRGPNTILNQAEIHSTDAAGTPRTDLSNVVKIRLTGGELPNAPDNNRLLTIDIGDLAVGESEQVIVDVNRTS